VAHEMSLAAGCANVIVLPWSSRWRRTLMADCGSPRGEIERPLRCAAIARLSDLNDSKGPVAVVGLRDATDRFRDKRSFGS